MSGVLNPRCVWNKSKVAGIKNKQLHPHQLNSQRIKRPNDSKTDATVSCNVEFPSFSYYNSHKGQETNPDGEHGGKIHVKSSLCLSPAGDCDELIKPLTDRQTEAEERRQIEPKTRKLMSEMTGRRRNEAQKKRKRAGRQEDETQGKRKLMRGEGRPRKGSKRKGLRVRESME